MQQSPSATPAAPDFELAISHLLAGRLPEAERICLEVLALEPANPHALHMLAVIRIGSGAREEGLRLLERALATGVKHPAIELVYGRLLLDLGRLEEAVPPLRRSLALDPRQPGVIALLAKSLKTLGDNAEARRLLDNALAAWPDDPYLLPVSAVIHLAQGAFGRAEADLKRALAVSPSSGEAYGNLAAFYEHSNRPEDVQRLLDAAAQQGLVNSTSKLVNARLLRNQGQAAEARTLLTDLQAGNDLTPSQQQDLYSELGWCSDALGDAAAAMTYFQEANDRALKLATVPPELPDLFPRQVASLTEFYRGNDVPASEAEGRAPAFLVGFPRSGTTLLDTMLGAHPQLWVMEERPTIQTMLDVYTGRGLRYAEDLAELTPRLRAEIRAAYRQLSRAAGWDGTHRLLDKSPWATAHVGFIHHIFPDAPVVCMVRHPCDVVLSCFMNNFEIHTGSVHFVHLDSTVDLYCSIMDLWQLYQQRLPFKYQVLRYEDLLASPETEMRRLIGFLDLPWMPQVLDNRAAALDRGYIPTPSYNQVSQPLYQRSSGRWRRYEAYLEPYRSRLAPYIRAFGYDA